MYRDDHMRKQVAQEAARLMSEHGIEDFQHAKRKAAERLGYTHLRSLPRNIEIEDALQSYQRIFKSDVQDTWLHTMRMLAIDLMEMLSDYEPRLTGNVLSGNVNEHSDITMHIFTDCVEDMMKLLHKHDIDYAESIADVKYGNRIEQLPKLSFYYLDVHVQLRVFPHQGIREAPLSPVDGKPMRRASIAKVKELVETDNI